MKNPLLASLFTLLILGAGCVQPTSNIPIPKGWQTYTNTEDQYAISYPAGEKLPNAVGEKERTMNIVTLNVSDDAFDANGCWVKDVTGNGRMMLTINNFAVCKTVVAEGAAGSIYRTEHYAVRVSDSHIADVQFTIRYVNDVRVYGGCETEADQTKERCQDLAFNEDRDTQLFDDIMNTLTATGF